MSTNFEPYNPDWPSQYTTILKSLTPHFHSISIINFTHIGSTSIPTLCSRPVIDILITVPVEDTDPVRRVLEDKLGYGIVLDLSEAVGVMFDSRANITQHAHSIFLCEQDGLAARSHLAIRDLLLHDSELRAEYAALKQTHAEDAVQPPDPSYQNAKTAFLQQLLILSLCFTPSHLLTLLATTAPHRWTPHSTARLQLREYELADTEGMYALESNPANARYQSWAPWTRNEARQNVVRGIWRSYSTAREVVELAVISGGAFVGRIGGRVHTGEGVVREKESEGEEVLDSDNQHIPPLAEKHSTRTFSPRHIDLWYSFLPSAQGRGLATEAMRLFIALMTRREKARSEPSPPAELQPQARLKAEAEQTLQPAPDVVELQFEIECDPRNAPSWRLAERLGFEKHSFCERAWECKGEWVGSVVYRKSV